MPAWSTEEDAILATEGPTLGPDLADRLGVRSSNLRRTMTPLIARGEVHVARYVISGFGKPKALYAVGAADSAPQPKARSKKRVQADFRKRMKRERPVEHVLRYMRGNAKARAGKRADVAAAWITGGVK